METLVESNPLINLNCDQLLARCDDLVDKATRDALKHCYEELFKEAVMKCVLKQVLKEEIQHLSREKEADWKRVAFVDKISCLTQASRDTEKPKAATPRRNDKQTGISTDKLLLSGYLRTEMDTADNHHFPVEILSVCQHFFGDCSNMIAPNQLIIYNHKTNTYGSVFDESKQNMQALPIPRGVLHFDDPGTTMQLIAPYKVGVFAQHEHSESISVSDVFPQQSDATEISVNVQTIGTLPSYGDPSHKELTNTSNNPYAPRYQPAYSPASLQATALTQPTNGLTPVTPTAVATTGVAQFFDRARLRLLNIGGWSDNPPQYTPMPNVVGVNPPLMVGRRMSDVVYSMPLSSPSMHEQFRTAYKRRNVSLCDVDQSQLAIIGGEGNDRDSLFGASTIATSPYFYGGYDQYGAVVDWVELYDLEKDESVAIKNLNRKRRQCGTYYNKKSENIVVFGGTSRTIGAPQYYQGYGPYNFSSSLDVEHTMELYDFHRNIWLEIPDKTCHAFKDYPCIWSVGGQCIFVADLSFLSSAIHCEWIDLREARVNGTNKSRFYAMSQPLFSNLKDAMQAKDATHMLLRK